MKADRNREFRLPIDAPTHPMDGSHLAAEKGSCCVQLMNAIYWRAESPCTAPTSGGSWSAWPAAAFQHLHAGDAAKWRKKQLTERRRPTSGSTLVDFKTHRHPSIINVSSSISAVVIVFYLFVICIILYSHIVDCIKGTMVILGMREVLMMMRHDCTAFIPGYSTLGRLFLIPVEPSASRRRWISLPLRP